MTPSLALKARSDKPQPDETPKKPQDSSQPTPDEEPKNLSNKDEQNHKNSSEPDQKSN